MRVAVTGGIGSGKSTVVEKLHKLLPEYKVISIDALVGRIYDNMDQYKQLEEKLAILISGGPGSSIRATRENVVLALRRDPDLLTQLEDDFAPYVLAELEKEMACEVDVIVEFPLLSEMGMQARFDFIISVEADEKVRRDRVRQRMGFNEDKISMLMTRQTTDEERRRIAHYSFLNQGLDAPDIHTRIISVMIKTRNDAKIGVFAGSFDPITNGHIEIARKALRLLDHVVFVVASNPNKKSMFTAKERLAMIQKTTNDSRRVHVVELLPNQMVVALAMKLRACCVIRGLRNNTDFDYEQQIALVNATVAPHIETMCFITPRQYTEVSSSMVKSLVGLDNWEVIAANYVPPLVLHALNEKVNP